MNDLISRQAAIDAIGNDIMGGLNYRRILRELPAAQERKKGKWIDRGEDFVLRWLCSECGRKDMHIYNYCPDCGLDMRGEDNEC